MSKDCFLWHWDWPIGTMNVHVHWFLWLFPCKHCCDTCKTGCFKVSP
jgi:hypothetical protein